MTIAIPFNNDPVSTVRRVTSYTIPTGFYAYVTVFCDASGVFSIDGNAAQQGEDSGATGTDFDTGSIDQTISTVATYTVPTGYYFQGQVLTVSGSGAVEIDGTPVAFDGSVNRITPCQITAGTGSNIAMASGSGYLTGAVIRNSSPSDAQDVPTMGHYWVAEGSVLTESGTVYMTVSLFNKIS